jgi:iron-sulfur cluster assembly accessory protein
MLYLDLTSLPATLSSWLRIVCQHSAWAVWGQKAMEDLKVTVSERAAQRIAAIVAGAPDKPLLRVSVEGGGCSGFQYKFDLVGASEVDDLIIERAGARVLIDQVSLAYLAGSEIDFVDDLIGSSFKVINPNATASCGCGTSFSI